MSRTSLLPLPQDELIRVDAVTLREQPAQIDGRGRIAVEQDGVELLRRQPVPSRIWLRPLVRVEPHIGFDLLPGPVRRERGEIVSGFRKAWGHGHRVRSIRAPPSAR